MPLPVLLLWQGSEACSSRCLLGGSQHIGRGNQVRSAPTLGLHHVGHAKVSISQNAWCTDPQDHPGLLSPLLEVADHVAWLVFAKGRRRSIRRSQVFLRHHTKLLASHCSPNRPTDGLAPLVCTRREQNTSALLPSALSALLPKGLSCWLTCLEAHG
jgi:hypothetical protein